MRISLLLFIVDEKMARADKNNNLLFLTQYLYLYMDYIFMHVVSSIFTFYHITYVLIILCNRLVTFICHIKMQIDYFNKKIQLVMMISEKFLYQLSVGHAKRK